jgi:hypothetical protein
VATLSDPSGTLALRLPEEEGGKFLKKYKTTLYEAYGAVMKESVAVPEALFKNTKQLKMYLALSYDCIEKLKPKAAKKKRC